MALAESGLGFARAQEPRPGYGSRSDLSQGFNPPKPDVVDINHDLYLPLRTERGWVRACQPAGAKKADDLVK
jgi:hypothetical protein